MATEARRDPDLLVEAALSAEGYAQVIGIDEVGRGAIAGPVAVGVALVRTDVVAFPAGLRDSKVLSEKKRTGLEAPLLEWCVASAVGTGSAAEIDEHGITAMLGQAARRALTQLHRAGHDVGGAMILLDGSQDWLSPALQRPLTVRTRVKADRDCASVAAAAVLAKVARDREMIAADARLPGYAWASNKGYGSAAHYAGIDALGLTDEHRKTWIHR